MSVVLGYYRSSLGPQACGVGAYHGACPAPSVAFAVEWRKEAKGSVSLRLGRKSVAGGGAGSVDRRGRFQQSFHHGAGEQAF